MFFDIEKEVDRGALSESLKIDDNKLADITAISSGKGLLVIGDSHGKTFTVSISNQAPMAILF